MGATTGIEWTDATWNPVTGCTKVSAGCDHCYAEKITERFRGKGSFATVTLHPDRLYRPLHWRKPRRVFVNSMSDLFHDDVPSESIAAFFAVMAAARQHTFQILTKRHARMRSLLNDDGFVADVYEACVELAWEYYGVMDVVAAWPLPNVWLGVSTENQTWADIRVPALLDTPAAVRWISAEPLLGPIDLGAVKDRSGVVNALGDVIGQERAESARLDWVVVGGESGRGARPMRPAWARTIREQCVAVGVPFLFKQWGNWAPDGSSVVPVGTVPDNDQMLLCSSKKLAGRELDGRIWDEFPNVHGKDMA